MDHRLLLFKRYYLSNQNKPSIRITTGYSIQRGRNQRKKFWIKKREKQ